MVNVPLDSPGIPKFESETYQGPVSPVISDTPPLVTIPAVVPADSSFSIYQAVELDASGELVPAVQGVNEANAILTGDVVTGAGETTTIDVYVQGCFDPAMLVWDVSYDSDAKKDAAFFGHSAPHNIVLKRRYYGPV